METLYLGLGLGYIRDLIREETAIILDFQLFLYLNLTLTLYTLKVENFAGTKFRGSKQPRNFCVSRVLNFAVAPSKYSFASIKFRGRTFQVNFAGIKFRGCTSKYVSRELNL